MAKNFAASALYVPPHVSGRVARAFYGSLNGIRNIDKAVFDAEPLGEMRPERLNPHPEPFAADWRGGFFCPCHGSLIDLAGRVYKNKPAPDNLAVPPYKFLGDTKLLIGEDTQGA